MKRNGVRPSVRLSVRLSQFARYSSEWRVYCCAWAGLGHPSLAAAAARERELCHVQWRRQDFVTGEGEVRYGSIGGLEYEVPQSGLYCLCINVALCSTALQCICRVIRRSSMTMKAHTYYIIFGRPPIGGEASPLPPWRRHWPRCQRT